MIGPLLRPVLLVSMSQRIESTNLVRCKLKKKKKKKKKSLEDEGVLQELCPSLSSLVSC